MLLFQIAELFITGETTDRKIQANLELVHKICTMYGPNFSWRICVKLSQIEGSRILQLYYWLTPKFAKQNHLHYMGLYISAASTCPAAGCGEYKTYIPAVVLYSKSRIKSVRKSHEDQNLYTWYSRYET